MAATSALLLAGCGGGDKVTDVNSSIAQDCKAGLAAMFDKARTAGGDLSDLDEDDAPSSCKKVADGTGQEILRQITSEASAKVRAELGTSVSDQATAAAFGGSGATASDGASSVTATGSGAGIGGTSGAGAGAGSGPAAVAGTGAVTTQSAPQEDKCAGFTTSSGKPASLPVGNTEYRLEVVKLEQYSAYTDTFSGSFKFRYLGKGTSSIGACTRPDRILVYRNGKQVTSFLTGGVVVAPGERNNGTVFSKDKFVKGPYTYVVIFKVY